MPRSLFRRTLAVASIATATSLLPQSGSAQVRGEWNQPRVMALVQQSRDLRHRTAIDSAFQAYSAKARGFVYFFLDRPDEAERTLVKTDQIALELYWRAPNETHQRITGLRDRKELPTTIKYHLDHLTVVQDDFGDEIRMGDGDEVRAVPHPVGPGSEGLYDFRLADSLTITLPSGPVPDIRVYEVQVRPKDFERPGVIGTVFLERGSGAIVRMSFTFTPSSYVDPHLDYIRISLDNMAWDGEFWLPFRQQVEIRRELPLLEFLAGSVIRGRFEIGGYQINPDLPEGLFRGPRVTSVSVASRKAFPFEEEIHARIDDEGLSDSPDLERIRREAYEVIGRRYLSGLRPGRLYVPRVSSLLRHNRAEGLFAGGGLAFQPTDRSRIKITGGYAFGRSQPSASVEISKKPATAGPSVRLWLNRLEDLGPMAGASGVVNSLGSIINETDYLDPFFSSGASLGHRWLFGGGGDFTVSVGWRRIRSASDVVSDGGSGYRPVRTVTEGDETSLQASLGIDFSDFRVAASVKGGSFGDDTYGVASGSLGWERRLRDRGTVLSGSLDGSITSGGAPSHELLLIGGRHTLPGLGFRSFVGSRMGLLRVEASQSVFAPWLYLRAFGAAGGMGGRSAIPRAWTGETTDGVAASAGLGIAVGWDVVRLDLGRGLTQNGDWELVFSAHKRFWPWL
jgi:hypothetical protein